MNVHWEWAKCLFIRIWSVYFTNGTPFFWGGITFMLLHQIRQFKWFWMCLKTMHKSSLDPIRKKITLSAQILLESLCVTNLIKYILEPCYPKLVGIRLVIYQSWAILWIWTKHFLEVSWVYRHVTGRGQNLKDPPPFQLDKN